MNTEPRESDAVDATGDAENYEQIPPPEVLHRPDEETEEREYRTSESHNNASPRQPRRKWTYKQKQTFIGWLIATATVIYTFGFLYSLREIRLSREIENRAWINFQTFRFEHSVQDIKNGERLKIITEVVNTGRTPALKVKGRYGWDFFAKLPNELPEPTFGFQDSQAIIPPINTPFSFNFIPAEMTDSKATYVLQRNLKFALWGVLEYDDIFGNHRKTHFCFLSDSNETTDLFFCPNGNYVE